MKMKVRKRMKMRMKVGVSAIPWGDMNTRWIMCKMVRVK